MIRKRKTDLTKVQVIILFYEIKNILSKTWMNNKQSK